MREEGARAEHVCRALFRSSGGAPVRRPLLQNVWSATKPMSVEEFMLDNVLAIKKVNPKTIGWVYRNGIKALPWHTSVRKLMEQRSQWGLFMPKKGCMPAPGHYGASAVPLPSPPLRALPLAPLALPPSPESPPRYYSVRTRRHGQPLPRL